MMVGKNPMKNLRALGFVIGQFASFHNRIRVYVFTGDLLLCCKSVVFPNEPDPCRDLLRDYRLCPRPTSSARAHASSDL